MVRKIVSNARAAAVLAGVALKSTLPIQRKSGHHLVRLCEQATEELRDLSGVRNVAHNELTAVLVHVAFLQGTDSDLSAPDFEVIRRLGVLHDTEPPRVVAPKSIAGPATKRLLRRYEMPDVFGGWLHFVTRFGLKSASAGDFEETVAEHASLALIAPQTLSYFDASYWSSLYALPERKGRDSWRHPFVRTVQKGCMLVRLTDHFAATSENGLNDGALQISSVPPAPKKRRQRQ